MRLPWISRRFSQRAATRRKKAAPLRVRRLERRRVLDAAVADLVFAPADLDGSTAVHDTNEGTPITVTADASGSGQLLYDWKVIKDATVVAQSFSQTLNFTPLDDGNYTVTLKISDALQSSATRTEEVLVHNLRPVLTVADDQVTNEGTPLNLSAIGAPPLAVFIDDGKLDTHTATVDWGDGSAIEAPVIFAANGSGALGGSHTYADNGVFTVTVTVTDDDGGTATESFLVTVNNVAPTGTLNNNGPAGEGSSATVTFTNQLDPSTADTTAGFHYAYDVNNDGTFDVGDGTYAGSITSTSQMVSAALLAEGPGSRTVRAWIIDKDGGHTEYTTNVTINNVAPALINIAANDNTIDEGQTATIKMTIDDPGALDVFEVAVDWKDGAPADTITGLGMVDASGAVGGTTYEWDAQARELTVSHLYPDDNPTVTSSDVYAVALTVRDDDLGVSPPYQVDVTVSNVRPVLGVADDQTVDEGELLELTGMGSPVLGVFIDDGEQDTHTATVDWGDGSSIEVPTVNELNGSGALGATHTYTDDGIYTVTVTVTDDDGGTDSQMFQVSVGNIAPTATLNNNGPVDEGSSATVTFSNQFDPGLDDTTAGFRYAYDLDNDGTFDVGDGTYAGSVGMSSQLVSAALLAEGPGSHTLTGRIIDQDGGFTDYTTTIIINNVNPELVNVVVTDASIDEGETAEITMTIDDPGVLDTFEVDVNWQDGGGVDTIVGLGAANTSGTVGDTAYEWDAATRELTVRHLYRDDNPTATPSDLYQVQLAVRDDDGGAGGPYQANITVSNVRPVLGVADDQNVNEGQLLDLSGLGAPVLGVFIDDGKLDTHTATVNWGDGSATEVPTVFEANGSGAITATHTYADDGVYTVTVTVMDDDGGIDTQQFQVIVGNVDPSLTVTPSPTAINEGSSVSFDASFSDPGFDNPLNPGAEKSETFTYDVDWGDGRDAISGQTVADTNGSPGTPSTGMFNGSHTYADDGVYTVTVTIHDDDGGSHVQTFEVTVSNVSPTLSVTPSPTSINEGGSVSFDASFSDPGFDNPLNPGAEKAETFTYDVDWGDGRDAVTGQTVADTNGSLGTPSTGMFNGSHTYADDGVYTVTVTIHDDDGGSHVQTFEVTVANVSPTLVVTPSPTSINEGGEVSFDASFSDPGFDNPLNPGAEKAETFTYDIDWGDGRDAITGQSVTDTDGAPGEPSTGMFDGSHTYADDGVYIVTVTIYDDDGGSHVQTFEVAIANVSPALAVTPSPTSINEGGIVNFDATFSDPGFDNPLNPGAEKAETFTYDIDWGDGRDAVTGQVVADANGSPGVPSTGMFSGSHTYADDGVYTVTVTIHDDDDGSHVQTFQVTVSNVSPTLAVTPSPTSINEGGAVNFDATFSDPGFDNPLNPAAERSETFTYDVEWGDGRDAITGQTVADTNGMPGTPSAGMFNGSHTYADDGVYTVTVTIHDDDGGSHVQTFEVTVANVAPTLALPNGNQNVDEGELLSLNDLATFSDPGFDNPLNPGAEKAETFTYDVDWGDDRDAIVGASITDINGGPGVNSTGTIAGSHTYADNGLYTVTVTIHDDDGGSHTLTFEVTVNNVNPTLGVTPSTGAINEGQSVSFDAIFSDPGFDNPANTTDPGNGGETAESFTYDVDWGDGRDVIAGQAVADTNGSPGVISTGNFNGTHAYADNGTYTITVTIHDDDGGVHVQTFTVIVANVDPTLTGTNGLVLNEGQQFTLSGLGVGLEDPGFDNPLNTTDPANGGEVAETFEVVRIEWGDGKLDDNTDGDATDPVSIVNRVSGGVGVTTKAQFDHAAHAFADNGTYTITVTLKDDDGNFVEREFTIVVNNVAPTLALTNQAFTINEGDTLNIPNLGTFTDPGFSNPLNVNDPANGGEVAETFSYTINWGDGTATQTGQLPSSLVDGSQGVLTMGGIANSHLYADNDADNKYTITVTLSDDDGGEHVQTIEVTVLNVNPTLNPIAATDIDANTGTTTLTLTFADPGADSFQIMVDWGDKLGVPNPADRFVVEQLYAGATPNTFVIVHQYLGPPDPLNPTADIVISVKIRDDDFAVANVVQPGESNVEAVAISNPGIQDINIAINTTPDVPRLDVSEQPMTVAFVADQRGGGQTLQIPDLRSGGGEVAATAERYLELRIVNPDGTESEGYKIKDEALTDLRAFFKTLPDGKYRIYLIRTENDSERLVIEVDVRGGRVIDVSDDSEGTRDRPPTGEEETGEAASEAVPLEQNPNLEPAPVGGQGQGDTETKSQGEIVEQRSEDDTQMSLSSPLLISLSAAALAAEPWSRRVDEALANADETAWQRLRRAGRSGRNGCLSRLTPARRQRNAPPLDYNRN